MGRKAGKSQSGSWTASFWELVNLLSPMWPGPLRGRALRETCLGQCSQASCLGLPRSWLWAEAAAASGRLSRHSPTRCSSQQPRQLGRESHHGVLGGQGGAALSPLPSRCPQMGYGSAPPLTNKQAFYRLSNPTRDKPDCQLSRFPRQGLTSLVPDHRARPNSRKEQCF